MSQIIEKLLAGENCDSKKSWERAVIFLWLELNATVEPRGETNRTAIMEFANKTLRFCELQVRLRINARDINVEFQQNEIWTCANNRVVHFNFYSQHMCSSVLGVNFVKMVAERFRSIGLKDPLSK